MEWGTPEPRVLVTENQSVDIGAMESYIQSLDKLTNWSVFRTKSGYMGRGPRLTQRGDHVCLEGSKTPFIIRKTKVPFVRQLVGECYVQDLMHKEALYASVPFWRWGPTTLV